MSKMKTATITMSVNVPVTFKLRVRKVGDEWGIVDIVSAGSVTAAVVRDAMLDEDREHMEQLAEAAP